MQSKISLKNPYFVVVLGGLAVIALIVYFFTFDLSGKGFDTKISPPNMTKVESDSKPPVKQIIIWLPIRLRIPKIKVNAIIEQAGLTPGWAVDVPKNPINAAWFNLGPRPGDKNSAVITGHYGYWKKGMSWVFNDLSKLKKGDLIYIEDESNRIITFVVREIRIYKQNQDVPEIFAMNDEKSYLNLITCQWAWNVVKKSYPNRLVVFTDRQEVINKK